MKFLWIFSILFIQIGSVALLQTNPEVTYMIIGMGTMSAYNLGVYVTKKEK